MKKCGVILCGILIILLVANVYALLYEQSPVEMIISRRMSVRSYTTTAVSRELLMKVLWAAHQYQWSTSHSIIVYVCNSTAAYRLAPSSSSLALWKTGDYRGLGGQTITAPYQFYTVYDKNIGGTNTGWALWANAEAGRLVQNIYLETNALNLGTVCLAARSGVATGLGLPSNEYPLYKMPLGYPASPYTNYQNLVMGTRPSSASLPAIQDSSMGFVTALGSLSSSRSWSTSPVTSQELSQVLWAAYGSSYYRDTSASPAIVHRTVPSAHHYYPMRLYAITSSGVYRYNNETHSLTTIVSGDKRATLASACGNSWASSAPLIIMVMYFDDNSTQYEVGGEETYVEVGLISQDVYLEGKAWNLAVDWGKANTNEAAVRTALGLTDTRLHPTSIITVGHPLVLGDINHDGIVDIFDVVLAASAFGSTPLDSNWNQAADLNNDDVVDILDIVLLANDFGKTT